MNILPGLSLFSPKKPDDPKPPPPIPTPAIVADSSAERDRREQERLARKRRSGLAATRLTSGLGDDETELQRSTLGGT